MTANRMSCLSILPESHPIRHASVPSDVCVQIVFRSTTFQWVYKNGLGMWIQ